MTRRARLDAWIGAHRRELCTAWIMVGAVVLVGMRLGPEAYMIRGIAPWPRLWAMAFFASLWCWVALRFIAGWIWAWVVMAFAPLLLAYPIRDYLGAVWLMPLLLGIAGLSALTVIVVVAWEWRKRRVAEG